MFVSMKKKSVHQRCYKTKDISEKRPFLIIIPTKTTLPRSKSHHFLFASSSVCEKDKSHKNFCFVTLVGVPNLKLLHSNIQYIPYFFQKTKRMDEQVSVLLNNNGVECIRNGQFQDAIHHLSLALKASKEILHTPIPAIPRDDKSVVTKESNCSALNRIMTRVPCHSYSSDEGTCDDDWTSNVDEGNFVYRSPIEIPSSRTGSPTTPLGRDLSVLSTAIVFNLALAHHMAAMDARESLDVSDSKVKVLLRRAMNLYHCSLRIMEVQADDASPYFVIATMNNLTQIHLELGEQEKAASRCQQLFSLLLIVGKWSQSSSEESSPSSDPQNVDYECFFRTVFSLMFSHGNAGAPAA